MKVLLTHPTAWPEVTRGAERYLHELSAALLHAGHDVTVLTSAADPGRREVLGVPVVAFPRGRQPAFAARCAAWAVRHRPDVWHANGLYDAAAAAALPGVRSVFTAHGPWERGRLTRRPRRQAFALARRSDAVVCVSPEAAARVRADWGVAAHVVPPGVDTAALTPGGTRHAGPVVLYAGTLASPRKNVPLLLAGAALARRELPSLEVHLAGPGTPPPLPEGVRHVGVLEGEALREAYRSAWVTALVSEREVFGMAVVESLACGTPAVVLDDGWGPSGLVAEGTG
ncbi:MAG: glycosyltransferase family 4 protein, partial [Mycobacteriales bacterium]